MASARILVVVDDGIIAMDIQSKLESLGYEVPATEGMRWYNSLWRPGPILILMDISLDGIEAAKRIRSILAHQ